MRHNQLRVFIDLKAIEIRTEVAEEPDANDKDANVDLAASWNQEPLDFTRYQGEARAQFGCLVSRSQRSKLQASVFRQANSLPSYTETEGAKEIPCPPSPPSLQPNFPAYHALPYLGCLTYTSCIHHRPITMKRSRHLQSGGRRCRRQNGSDCGIYLPLATRGVYLASASSGYVLYQRGGGMAGAQYDLLHMFYSTKPQEERWESGDRVDESYGIAWW